MSTQPATSRYRIVPIVLAQAIGLLGGVASVKLNSHLIPPATLGFYGVFLTLAPIGMWVVHVGLLKFVSRQWAASPDRHALAREIAVAWARRLPWLALAAAVAAGFVSARGEAGPMVVWLALFFSASLLALGNLAQNALQALRAHWRDCAVSAASTLTRSFAPPLLYAALGASAPLLLMGFSLHALVVAAAGWWAVSTTLGSRPAMHASPPQLTSVYEGPLFITLAFVSWLVGGLNRWLVAGFYGDTEAGYFTLAGSIALVVVSMLGTIIMQYLQPGLYALGDGPAALRPALARRVDLAAAAYTLLAGALLTGVHFIAPRLVGPLISPNYRPALAWIVPAGCFGITAMLGLFYHIMLIAGRRERACGPVDLTAAAVLASGCVAAAAAGTEWFMRWLAISPLLPWGLNRTLARHYLFKPDATPAPAPAR